MRVIEDSRECFEPIFALMVAWNAFLSARQYLHEIKSRPEVAVPLATACIRPSLPLSICAPISDTVLVFDPSSLLLDVSRDRKPRQIQFREEALPTAVNLIPEGSVEMPDLSPMQKLIIQSVFINFYETQICRVKAKWTADMLQWDETWKFAWVVRNALAHDGRVSLKHDRIPSVSWKTIRFDRQQENGREIIYNDIGDGDFIVLIDELDRALTNA